MDAKLICRKEFVISEVDPRLYGSFIEHMGRVVYDGIYQPNHKSSDKNGFRDDVLGLVKDLNIPLIRYPGGNFVSGFNWEDSIGPVKERPIKADLAWRSIEKNEVGLHEFYDWAKKSNSEIMYAVNLGTKGVEDAKNIVEYANFEGGTYWSELRKKNGKIEPFKIKTWCLGNEMDGSWQIGAKTAEEYGRIAKEAAKAMKLVDDSIELVLCGSSFKSMPTFGSWELTALDHAYEHIDYISLHQYYGNQEDDIKNYLARTLEMDEFIVGVISMCDAIKAKKHSDKQINLSFDEWNIWYHTLESDKKISPWQVAPKLLEEHYNFEDALLIGGMLITLLKHSDRIKIACLAQLVNVLAPIMTNPEGAAWKQTIYYPFQQVSLYGRGTVLDPKIWVEGYSTKDFAHVPYIEAIAVHNNQKNELVVFALSRSFEKIDFEIDLNGFKLKEIIEFSQFTGFDIKEINTEKKGNVKPVASSNINLSDDKVTAKIFPLSWNMIRISLEE